VLVREKYGLELRKVYGKALEVSQQSRRGVEKTPAVHEE
jgi:hypothetical protein